MKPVHLVEKLSEYSVMPYSLLHMLRSLATKAVETGRPGDIVECGVRNGGSAAVLSLTITQEVNRKLWLYDSFQGLPCPGPQDGPEANDKAGTAVGDKKKVEEALKLAGFPLDRTIIHGGWFQDTFQKPRPDMILFLHIDCDWYDSVYHCLEVFYDKVVPGGVILLDDFGHWEGCREAFYDFVSDWDIYPLVERYGHSQMYWVKGRTDNRDMLEKKDESD